MNWKDKSIFIGDNLEILRGMDSKTVDLIYLDPPFNSNKTYSAPLDSQAAGAMFKDAWTLDDIKEHEHGLIADVNPTLYHKAKTAVMSHTIYSYSVVAAIESNQQELKTSYAPDSVRTKRLGTKKKQSAKSEQKGEKPHEKTPHSDHQYSRHITRYENRVSSYTNSEKSNLFCDVDETWK